MINRTAATATRVLQLFSAQPAQLALPLPEYRSNQTHLRRFAVFAGTSSAGPVLVRTAVLACILESFLLLSRMLKGAGGVPQDLSAVPVACLASVVLLAFDRYGTILSRPTMLLANSSNAGDCGMIAPAAQDVATMHSELATPKAFDNAVRRALSHLGDPTKLAASPLLHLRLVTAGLQEQGLEDTCLQRAAVLRANLVDLLAGLQPRQREGGGIGLSYRFYNCLYYPYVLGIGRRRAPTVLRTLRERRERDGSARSDLERVLVWLLDVDEDTYFKWQRRGSDSIALTLRERERLAGGIVPGPDLPRDVL